MSLGSGEEDSYQNDMLQISIVITLSETVLEIDAWKTGAHHQHQVLSWTSL
jgi:hypothetical protein